MNHGSNPHAKPKWSKLVSLALLSCTLLLTACGFHLRGHAEFPRWFKHIAVIVEQAHRDLNVSLVDYLHAYDLSLESSPSSAQYWLIIQKDTFKKQITSVSSSTTPRQYQLTYTVQFKLMQAKGRELIPSSNVSITRQITINSNRILGSNQEEDIIAKEMRRDAVIQIMNRVSVALSKI